MKRNKLKTVVLGLGIALFMSNYSFGQSQDRQERKERPTFAKLLKEMDANEDGKLSENEVDGPLKEQFAAIDADKDGFITEAEMKPKVKEVKSEKKSKGKGKGMPTYTELLEQMDADKDGKLSKSEVKGPLKNDFSKVDTDKDGFLSEAELKNAPKPERPQRR